MECWILTLQHVEYLGKLFTFGRIFWLDRHGNHGLCELNRWQLNHVACVAKRVSRDGIARTDGACDVAALQCINLSLLFSFGCMNLP